MNTIRLIAITLPMTLLLACGGGGGGTAAAPMNMPGPMTPPTVTLPSYAITDLSEARAAVDGSEPTMSMTEAQIVTEIQTRATAADYFEFSDFGGATGASAISLTRSSDGDSYSGDVPDIGTLTFSLDDIEDLSLVDDTNLVGFNSESQVVMDNRGVTVIQSRSAARQDDGTQLSFQSYGGWLNDSAFGVMLLDVTENAATTNHFTSFNFGDASGTNPISARYNGVMVGSTNMGDAVGGVLTVLYSTATDANTVDSITFSRVRNLNTGTLLLSNSLRFTNIPLTNGSFETDSGDIKGNFYGDNHEGVGGIFNSSTHNIVGAFGGVKE